MVFLLIRIVLLIVFLILIFIRLVISRRDTAEIKPSAVALTCHFIPLNSYQNGSVPGPDPQSYIMPSPIRFGKIFEGRTIMEDPAIVDPEHLAWPQSELDP